MPQNYAPAEALVLYEDNHLLAIAKPPNMPTQADASGDMDALRYMKAYIARKYGKPGEAYLGLCHRLDRPVGGVLLFARTSKAAARLTRQFAERDAHKFYVCVSAGGPRREALLEDYLVKDERGFVRVVDEGAPGAKLARLIARPVAERPPLVFSGVELLTGRSHQIRVQYAHAGYPLWGDARYGAGKPGQQIALWAARLTITHPTLGKSLTFSSAPPAEGAWLEFQPEIHSLCGEALQ